MWSDAELDSLLAEVRAITGEAAANILDARVKFDRDGMSPDQVHSKGINDFATEVDLAAERFLVSSLRPLIQDAGFLTEEGTVEQGDVDQPRWIIDPLDGTTNFMHGMPCYAVSVALEFRGEIVLGVVHEVTRGECFHARRGGGAWLADRALKVSGQRELADSLVATGFPYSKSGIQRYGEAASLVLAQCQDLRRWGAAAVDLANVAAGRLDAYYERGLNPWDAAAGVLLVREAGGIVRGFREGQDPVYGPGIIAGSAEVTDRIAGLITPVLGIEPGWQL